MREALVGWDLFAADPPGNLRPWLHNEVLSAGVHDVWCRPDSESPWRIQIILDEAADREWIFRHNPGIHRKIAQLGTISDGGIPYLVPEVQLLYKAKQIRVKDEADFAAALKVLTTGQREWLASAIHTCYGEGHPWLHRLGG